MRALIFKSPFLLKNLGSLLAKLMNSCYLTVEAAVQNAAGFVESNENYKVEVPVAETEEKKPEPSALEKFWKAVRDNPSDFTGWTYLLQYVEQQVRPCTCFFN